MLLTQVRKVFFPQPLPRLSDDFCACLFCLVCVGRVGDTAASPFGNLEFVRQVYGSGLAMRLATEQKMARDHHVMGRAPGLETSNLLGEIFSGRDTTMDFSDYLSLPENRPTLPMVNPHSVMERHLGMQI